MIMIVYNSISIIRNMVSNTKSTKIDSGIDLAKELDGQVEQKISQKHSFSTILLTNSRTLSTKLNFDISQPKHQKTLNDLRQFSIVATRISKLQQSQNKDLEIVVGVIRSVQMRT